MSKDEIEGKGLFAQRKVKSNRRQQLLQQMEVWGKLLKKLGEPNS